MSRYKKANRAAPKPKSRLPIWLVLIALGGVALIVVAALDGAARSASTPAATLEAHGAPKLKVDRDAVDFGNVKLGQTVQVSFEVTNVGDQALRFTEAPYVEVAVVC